MKSGTKVAKPKLPKHYTRYALPHTARAKQPGLILPTDKILFGISLFSHKHEGNALKALKNYCLRYYPNNKIDTLVAGTLQKHCFWHLVKGLDQRKLNLIFSEIDSFFPNIRKWVNSQDKSKLDRSAILELLAKALAKTLFVIAEKAQNDYIRKNFDILINGARCPILRWNDVVPDLKNENNQTAEKLRFKNYFEFLSAGYLADQQSKTGIYEAFHKTIDSSIDQKKHDGEKKYNLVIYQAKRIFESNLYLKLLVKKLIKQEIVADKEYEDKLNQFILDLYKICSRNYILEESASLLDLLDRGYTAVIYPSNISPAFTAILRTHPEKENFKWLQIDLDQIKPKENYADSSEDFGKEEKTYPLSIESADLEMRTRSSLTRYKSYEMKETLKQVKDLAIAASKKDNNEQKNDNSPLVSAASEYTDPLEAFEKKHSFSWLQTANYTMFKAHLARIRYLADLELWRVHDENPTLTASFHYEDQLTLMLAQTSSMLTETQLSDMVERIRYTVSEIDKDRYRGRCFQVEYDTFTSNNLKDELFKPFIFPDFPTELIPDYYEVCEMGRDSNYQKHSIINKPSQKQLDEDNGTEKDIGTYQLSLLQFNITLIYEIAKCHDTTNVPRPNLKEVKLGTPIVVGSKPDPQDPRLSFPIRLNFFSNPKDNLVLTAKFNWELIKVGFFSSSWRSPPQDPDRFKLSSKIRGTVRYPWSTSELKRYMETVTEGINIAKQEANLTLAPKMSG